MRVLLDTCAFLWLATDAPELSASARATLVDRGNDLFLSVVSVWEVAVKHRMGRLSLPLVPSRLVPECRSHFGIASLPLEEDACLQVDRLPDLHRDPFDRMLICQAVHQGLTLLTPDELIRQYPVPTAW
jgi:PIN domain nuclease of toxin-antitoxin system